MRPRPAVLLSPLLLALALAACLAGVAPARGVSRTALPALLALQQAQLAAHGTVISQDFGYSVALSGDTALVGTLNTVADYYDRAVGTAYVFVRSGGVWRQQAELTNGRVGGQFGRAVALEGDTAVIGAPGGIPDSPGAAYVFVRSGGVWTQQAELTAPVGSTGCNFGFSVALSGDTALIGQLTTEPLADGDPEAAYVFVRSGTAWTQQAELTTGATGAAHDWFGYSVALCGETALVGAIFAHGEAGAAYAFARTGVTWQRQAELLADDGVAQDGFGTSVAVSGATAVIGAAKHDVGGRVERGAAYVFTRSAGDWTQEAELAAAGGAARDNFGIAVAVFGERALVGAPDHDASGRQDAGAAYVFGRSAGAWTQQSKLTAGGAAGDLFGLSVALSADTALVGAPRRPAGGLASGAAYVFVEGRAKPRIDRLSPRSGERGSVVVITGAGFGARRATSVVKFGTTKCGRYVSWSDTRIRCRVPAKAAFGRRYVRVTTSVGTSNAKSFTVKR